MSQMRLRIRFSDGLEISARGVRSRVVQERHLLGHRERAEPLLVASTFFREPGEGVWDGWPGVLAWTPEEWTQEQTAADAPAVPAGGEPKPLDWSLVEAAPDRAGWSGFCQEVLKEIELGGLKKVVAARAETYRIREAFSEEGLEERLFSSPTLHGTHRFFLQTPWGAFLGASPEYLFHRQGKRLCVPAIAGTRPRGGSPEGDEANRADLLGSTKERVEHDCVKDAILSDLCSLGLNPVASDTEVLSLENLHHLYTGVKAAVSGQHALDFLRALHPTPALGGHPRGRAEEILRREPVRRGYFGAPIGFWSEEEDRMIVAIRSALIRGDTATIFAGAGIVAGSDPGDEWNETHRKMSAMRSVLRIPEARNGG